MKSLMKVVVTVAVSCCATFASASWTYDSGVNTLSDDTGWVINTVGVTGGIRLNSVKTVGSDPDLDFRDANLSEGTPAIKEIYASCFSGKSTIGEVWLPEQLVTLWQNAFTGSSLTAVHFPTTIKSIGNQAFMGCKGLVTLDPALPPSLTSLSTEAFRSCTALVGPVMIGCDGGAALSLGTHVFCACSELVGVVFKDNVTAVTQSMFENCGALESVVLPPGLKSIGGSAFVSCLRLRKVTPFLPATCTSIGSQAFYNDYRLAGELSIAVGNTNACSFGAHCFYNCDGITKLTVGEGVKSFPGNFMQYSGGLTEIVWHDGVTTLGGNAFDGCTALTTVTPSLTPSALTTVSSWAFYNCPLLEGEISLGFNGPVTLSGERNFQYVKATRVALGPGVTTIPSYFCQGDSAMTELSLGENITSIGAYAFDSCGAIRGTVTLPPGLTSVGNYAFNGCSGINLTPFLPATVTKVGEMAFWNCSGITGDLHFATNDVTASCSQYAFSGTGISRAFLGNGITTLPTLSFASCPNLTYVKLPENLQSMTSSFKSCGALKTVEPFLPRTITYMKEAFMYCYALTGDLWLGSEDPSATAPTLADYCFYQAYPLGPSITFGANVANIGNGNSFFYQDTKVKTVNFLGDSKWNAATFNGWGEYQARFVVPKDSATWNTFIADSCTVPTPAQLERYRADWPGEPDPRGVTKANPKNQWVVSYGMVNPGEINITVAGQPGPYGAESEELDPKYGLYEDVAAALPMTLTAPRYGTGGNVIYECRGYVTETPTPIGWGNGVTNALSGDGVRSVSYAPAEDGTYRFSWLWVPAGYKPVISVPADASLGTVTCSEPDLEGYYSAGSTMTVTAVPGTDVQFVKWTGDVPAGQETSPTITVTMDGVKTLTPEFATPWVHNSAAGTVSDGFWTLKVSGKADSLAIASVSVNSPLGVLDLTKPVKSGTASGAFVSIGQDAFKNNKVVTEVRIPATLRSIGSSAFASCSSITNITPFLPGTVTSIGQQAFESCSGLKIPLVIGEGVAAGSTLSVGGYTVRYSGVTDITIGPGLTTVPVEFANACGSLTNVTAHEGITSIGSNAFSNNGKLKTFSPLLPASLVTLGGQAFYQSGGLVSALTVGTNGLAVTFSGAHHFAGTSVTNAVFGEGVSGIPTSFLQTDKKLVNVEMADSVTVINGSAFQDCTGLKTVKLSNKLGILGGAAFQSCGSLTTIEPFLPNTTTNIGSTAFYQCKALSSKLSLDAKKKAIVFGGSNNFEACSRIPEVVLGTGVSSLPANFFINCTGVRKLYFKGKPTYASNTFQNWGDQQSLVFLPKTDPDWMAYMKDETYCTPFALLSRDLRDQFFDRYPNEKAPFGKLTSAANPAKQWVTTWNPFPAGTRIVFR